MMAATKADDVMNSMTLRPMLGISSMTSLMESNIVYGVSMLLCVRKGPHERDGGILQTWSGASDA